MATLKSPGQKKKGIVRIISFLLFILITTCASFVTSYINTKSLEWTKNHIETTGLTTELTQTEEEYRNSKGRKRTRDAFHITYTFEANDSEFEYTKKIDSSLFYELEESDPVVIWYNAENPEINNLKSTIALNKNSNNTVSNTITILPFSIGGSLFLYYLLSFIFVRESKHVLPEGFYTENTWLDVDDNYLVAIDNNDLVFFDIDKKQSSTVQKLYQNGAPLEEIIAKSKSSRFNRIPLSEIKELSSDHNSDTINIEHNDKLHSVEFLNQALKSHALDRIKPLIPADLNYNKNERSRLQAAVPSIVLGILLSAVIYFSSITILNVLVGLFVITKVVPTVISRLLDPTVTEEWNQAST